MVSQAAPSSRSNRGFPLNGSVPHPAALELIGRESYAWNTVKRYMYRSRDGQDQAFTHTHTHTRGVIPKPFISRLLAAKTTCTIRRGLVHAAHTLF